MPMLSIAVALLLPTPTVGGAPIHVDDERLVNTAGVSLVGLRWGEETFSRLGPGEAVEVRADSEAQGVGRCDLHDWDAALGQLGDAWAPFHLRTAGFLLDAVNPGTPGDPASAANIRALAEFDPAAAVGWARPPAARLALAARAGRHVAPGALLDRLLATIGPPMLGPLPKAYDGLGAPAAELRATLERHGSGALAALVDAPAWSADRGLEAPALLLVSSDTRAAVDRRLEAQGGERAARARRAFGLQGPPLPVEPLFALIEPALRAGDFQAAARAATLVAAAVVTRAAPLAPPAEQTTCYALDIAAQRALADGKATAAEAYLALAIRACPATPALRKRVAEVWRQRGDVAFHGADLALASGHYRAAWLAARQEIDQARLADTLADLARLQYADNAVAAGDRYLERARDLAPLREKVLAAERARPGADPRARVGLVLIIIFLGLFAMRRLRRIFKPSRQKA